MVHKETRQRFDDHAVKCMFVDNMRTMKQYHDLELKTRRDHCTCNVVFHELTLYYEKELRRTILPSVPDENSSKSESHYESIAAALKPLATVAWVAQKTKPENLESNLGPAWQLPEGSIRKRREKASRIEAEKEERKEEEREEEEERYEIHHATMIDAGPGSIEESMESMDSETWRSPISS